MPTSPREDGIPESVREALEALQGEAYVTAVGCIGGKAAIEAFCDAKKVLEVAIRRSILEARSETWDEAKRLAAHVLHNRMASRNDFLQRCEKNAAALKEGE